MNDLSEVQLFLWRLFENDAGVVKPRPRSTQYGSRGFKVGGKIFAMEVEGTLALKLPAERVGSLIRSGSCEQLEMGGRRMKEWIVVRDPTIWQQLAQEARQFVAGPLRN